MTAVCASIRIELDPAVVQQIEAWSAALEGACDLVRDEFLGRFDCLLAGGGCFDLASTSVAGDLVFVAKLSAAGYLELSAAAAGAAECHGRCAHGGPHAR